jgi:hypothetical protein
MSNLMPCLGFGALGAFLGFAPLFPEGAVR